MAAEDAISPSSPTPTCVATFSRASTAADGTWDKAKVPFEKSHELCKEMDYTRQLEKSSLFRLHASSQTLPDAPRIRLDCPSTVGSYCLGDLDTPHLNQLGEKLWWAGPTPDIVPLSQHTVLDRRIQITEDPSVHLLWTEGILYVKPLPAYLTSFAFWEFLMDVSSSELRSEERTQLIATCMGFLKTYACLIQRRSDFDLARRYSLLGSFEDISFEAFIAFISSFDAVPDCAISSRWRYGLLQLDALNFHSAIHLRRWHLNRFESRYSTYFSRFFPVVLFVFALFSVMLSAMQVIVAAKQMWDTDNKGLKRVLGIFIWFGTEAIGWSMGFGLIFVVWWLGISTNEVYHSRQTQKKVRKRLKEEGVCP
jgi:hypothetical protein